MSSPAPSQTAVRPSVESLTGRVRWTRNAYVALAGVFAVGVLVQVYFAGMAVFVDEANWELHTTFVHFIELIPLLLVGLGYLGRFPRRQLLLPALLIALLAVQYLTVGLSGSMVAAIHPVNALLIFYVSVVMVRESWRARTVSPDDQTIESAS